ncbi:MAG: flagellar biosynthesis protein FlgD [Pseudomonadales bacterium]|jgi:flagellar basal-body rod modification protein FlgD|uniref:flagellar hook assembly protein FlgD n=1 Tax=unclassified Ketobacter TaxID=2639109 RepID=UPI000C51940B|nr:MULTISPECIES: flagellar hook assembly protein FlgD [unclassified Ketobacter]MAQ24996.1 flagellar biosynthesis protein FlgD [Pseudomonadales bacterium]MEC8810541.1 flagellar hook assembly protein FlgD [Pseudomonadota bacterium]TNC89722.1 MAG: flagellar biosynthesis protein FlgD [Alcanivorax sp.]HAG97274.1 flagellar biosynthesis protein FlgD [Gammaproteobacteria bacterium]MBI26846.1 flagellar biosynthesis protein FlgD [Pseudomonadales bacterium]|tara:strand:+ start:50888 stop:51568 length:681 start_codon:yes stop_codon:yes gene_type:complete
MAIDGVQANSVLSDLAFSNQPETEKSQSQSDKDMFMRLLLAQIENQDPLKPTDQTDFVAQLAQFSSLEGIQNLNSTVQDIGSMYRSSQALQATALVGREVLIPGQVGYLENGGRISGTIEEGQASGDVMMIVKDASGQVVANRDLGNIGSAETPFSWDGANNLGEPLPEGLYSISIEGTLSGENEALVTSVYSRVNSVSIVDNQGGMLLNLNGIGQVESSEIQEVR